MRQRLPGIKKIETVSQNNIPSHVVEMAEVGIPANMTAQTDKICFVGNPICDIEESYDNQSLIEKASLKFNSSEDIDTKKIGFIFTTVENIVYLIGSKEKPPIIKKENTTGVPSGDAAGYTYTVTFEAKKALIPSIIS